MLAALTGLEGLVCTEDFPATWKLMAISLHHCNPYTKLSLNASRGDGENRVRK